MNKTRKKDNNFRIFLGILFIFSLYFIFNQVSAKELTPEKVIEKVSFLMVLPEEEPTVATVTKPELIKDREFFKNAKTGYKVLIYAKSGKAILYDPTADKIVDIAALNLPK